MNEEMSLWVDLKGAIVVVLKTLAATVALACLCVIGVYVYVNCIQ